MAEKFKFKFRPLGSLEYSSPGTPLVSPLGTPLGSLG
jgi:hypothetical protein